MTNGLVAGERDFMKLTYDVGRSSFDMRRIKNGTLPIVILRT